MYLTLLPFSVFVGIIIGLIGIGGGILLLPVLLGFGFTFPEAVAISLFLNAVPNTLPGLWLYYKNGHFRLKPALLITLATVIGIIIGSLIGLREFIPRIILIRIYTALVFIIGFYMLIYHCL